MEYVLFVACGILALIGLTEGFCYIKTRFMPKYYPKNYSIVRLYDDECAVWKLCCAGEQMKWLGKNVCRIAAYGKISPEKMAECRLIARKYDMIFCPVECVGRIIEHSE